MHPILRPLVLTATALLAAPAVCPAQFLDHFNQPAIDGWFTMTGDGDASVQLVPEGDHAAILVDADRDRHGVWWAIIKRDVSASLDLARLADPAYELRVEARVRVAEAPRRVNFMINTQRTTDFHQHLREYEIPDTDGWHVISMTTDQLDAGPGDQVFVQLGVTDWGPGKHRVELDYYRAEVVRRDQAGPDLGEPLLYHPPIPALATFAHHLPVAHDSIVHSGFPEVNFNDWRVSAPSGSVRVLSVDPQQSPVLRWDFSAFRGRRAAAAAVLELTTHSVALGGNYLAPFGADLGVEFGKVRVYEIFGGDPQWDQTTVTLNSLLQGTPTTEAFNPQMTQDVDVTPAPGGKTFVTLPRPVLQRLLDGTTRGLILRPLGAINAQFVASEETAAGVAPALHFNIVQD